jgi:hypothetical protein
MRMTQKKKKREEKRENAHELITGAARPHRVKRARGLFIVHRNGPSPRPAAPGSKEEKGKKRSALLLVMERITLRNDVCRRVEKDTPRMANCLCRPICSSLLFIILHL